MKLLTTFLFLFPLGICAQTPEPASNTRHPASSIQNPASSIQNPASSIQKTYCNPMDINYHYNFEQLNEKISYRSGADPVIVNHRGEYYLFVTISGGWWHSKDLIHWDYVVPDKWPMEDMCAPAALSVRDTLYRDTDPRNVFISWDPVPGATGYNIRWGIKPDKLYQTYQRFADEGNKLEIRALNKGQDYYFAIEAFNENGVSSCSAPVYCK